MNNNSRILSHNTFAQKFSIYQRPLSSVEDHQICCVIFLIQGVQKLGSIGPNTQLSEK